MFGLGLISLFKVILANGFVCVLRDEKLSSLKCFRTHGTFETVRVIDSLQSCQAGFQNRQGTSVAFISGFLKRSVNIWQHRFYHTQQFHKLYWSPQKYLKAVLAKLVLAHVKVSSIENYLTLCTSKAVGMIGFTSAGTDGILLNGFPTLGALV